MTLATAAADSSADSSFRGPGRACANCGAPLSGRYCAGCGQEGRDVRVGLLPLLRDLASAVFDVDGRLATTGRALRHPGRLSSDWFDGRRARYLHPLRLYLLASAVFLATVVSLGDGVIQIQVGPDDPAGAASQVDADADAAPALLPNLQRAATDPLGTRRDVFGRFGWAMILLVPVFAAGLAAFNGRRRRHYVEHLVFAVELHIAGFLALSAALVGRALPVARPATIALAALLLAGVGAYSALGMRRFYGRGLAASAAITAVLGIAYAVAAATTLATIVYLTLAVG